MKKVVSVMSVLVAILVLSMIFSMVMFGHEFNDIGTGFLATSMLVYSIFGALDSIYKNYDVLKDIAGKKY